MKVNWFYNWSLLAHRPLILSLQVIEFNFQKLDSEGVIALLEVTSEMVGLKFFKVIVKIVNQLFDVGLLHSSMRYYVPY